jgi:hypothetical protein
MRCLMGMSLFRWRHGNADIGTGFGAAQVEIGLDARMGLAIDAVVYQQHNAGAGHHGRNDAINEAKIIDSRTREMRLVAALRSQIGRKRDRVERQARDEVT